MQSLNLISLRLLVTGIGGLPIPESPPVPTDAAPVTYASTSWLSVAKQMVQSLDSIFFSSRLSASVLAPLDAISIRFAKSLPQVTDAELLFALVPCSSPQSMPSRSSVTPPPEYGPRSWPLKSLSPTPSIDHGCIEDRHRGVNELPFKFIGPFQLGYECCYCVPAR